MKRDIKKPKSSIGFLVDENLPPEVSNFIASMGYRVAHIGINKQYLILAPKKSTKDAQLKKWVQFMIFITKDKKLLKPGRFPSKNRGVFVLDCSDSTIMNTIYHLFDIGQYLWKKDFVLTDRRFMIGVDFFNELNLDGTLLKKY